MHTSALPPRSRPLALAVIATPLLWLAAEALSPPLKSDSAAQLAAVAAHPDRRYWYTVLLIAGTITLVPAAVGIARLAAARAPKPAALGAALVGFSGIVAVGDATSQLVTWQMVHAGAGRAQMAALLDRYDNSTAASIFFIPGGLALLAGAALLGVALWRSHAAPRWAAVTLAAGLAGNLIGFMAASVAVIALGAALMTPASLLLGRHLFGRSASPLHAPAAVAAAATN
jgi:hypothetical protein